MINPKAIACLQCPVSAGLATENEKLREALAACVELMRDLPTLNGFHGLSVLEHAATVLESQSH